VKAVELFFVIGWSAFWIYWLAAASTVKRGRVPWSRELRIRAVIVIIVIVLIRLGAFRSHEFADDTAKSNQASQASLVAILHPPKTVHTTSQAAITVTAMAVDSGSKYDESRSPAGPFTIP